jgi:hypothetical protein
VVISIERNKRARVIYVNVRSAGPVTGELETQTKFRDDNDMLRKFVNRMTREVRTGGVFYSN